jgi:hypothetical protein
MRMTQSKVLTMAQNLLWALEGPSDDICHSAFNCLFFRQYQATTKGNKASSQNHSGETNSKVLVMAV